MKRYDKRDKWSVSPPTSIHYIFLITTVKLLLSHEVNTFVKWNKTKWRKMTGTLLKLGAFWKCDSFLGGKAMTTLKRYNHSGFEIACHSLFPWLISKTLIFILLLMSLDIIVLFYNTLKAQIKKKCIDNC